MKNPSALFPTIILLFVLTNTVFIGVSYGQYSKKRIVSGQVLNADDNSVLAGVKVEVKGFSIKTYSDENGIFSIDVPHNADILKFSYSSNALEVYLDNKDIVDVLLNHTESKAFVKKAIRIESFPDPPILLPVGVVR